MRSVSRFALIVTLAFAISLPSRPAHALVAAVTVNPVIAAVGAATLLGGGVVAGIGGIIHGVECKNGCYLVNNWVLIGGAIGLVGLLILDADSVGAQARFLPLSDSEARAIGLTEAEALAYAGEFDEIQAILSEVSAKLARLPSSDVQAMLHESSRLWAAWGTLLSPEAFSAVQKVAGNLAQQLSEPSSGQ